MRPWILLVLKHHQCGRLLSCWYISGFFFDYRLLCNHPRRKPKQHAHPESYCWLFRIRSHRWRSIPSWRCSSLWSNEYLLAPSQELCHRHNRYPSYHRGDRYSLANGAGHQSSEYCVQDVHQLRYQASRRIHRGGLGRHAERSGLLRWLIWHGARESTVHS